MISFEHGMSNYSLTICRKSCQSAFPAQPPEAYLTDFPMDRNNYYQIDSALLNY